MQAATAPAVQEIRRRALQQQQQQQVVVARLPSMTAGLNAILLLLPLPLLLLVGWLLAVNLCWSWQ
jgi:hypothetical protein